MSDVAEKSLEVVTVDIKREDLRAIIIGAARQKLPHHHKMIEIDEDYSPIVLDDKYGGYVVTFVKKEQ